jgi:hypothetical protein
MLSNSTLPARTLVITLILLRPLGTPSLKRSRCHLDQYCSALRSALPILAHAAVLVFLPAPTRAGTVAPAPPRRKRERAFHPLREFRDSQLPPKRPIQHRWQQRVQFRLGGALQGGEFVHLGLQVVQVGDDAALLVQGREG